MAADFATLHARTAAIGFSRLGSPATITRASAVVAETRGLVRRNRLDIGRVNQPSIELHLPQSAAGDVRHGDVVAVTGEGSFQVERAIGRDQDVFRFSVREVTP